jgi:hypothetical protein
VVLPIPALDAAAPAERARSGSRDIGSRTQKVRQRCYARQGLRSLPRWFASAGHNRTLGLPDKLRPSGATMPLTRVRRKGLVDYSSIVAATCVSCL